MKITIGTNIKRLRTEKGVTQEQLAEAMNVTYAAVSKWERGETYPDITLLQPLAYYFNVSLDELVGYDREKVSEDVDRLLEEYGKTCVTDREKAGEIIADAYREYPNDYRIMDAYMWHVAGSYANNDPAVLLGHKDEFLAICDKLIEGCTWERARLDAWNMKAKILHAEGKTDEALKIYMSKFTNWYQTGGQKIEQLFSKDTPEFTYRLRLNMYQLCEFAADKLVKSYFYDKELSYEEKIGTAELIGDELYGLAKDRGAAYFIVQARSIYGRLFTDLKARGGAVGDCARLLDKFLSATEKLVALAGEDKSLYDAFIGYQNTDDYLKLMIDCYAGGGDPRSAELREDPEFKAVIEKYKVR